MLYSSKVHKVIWGTKNSTTLAITESPITSTYQVIGFVNDMDLAIKANFNISLTTGAGETATSIFIKLEGSNDGVNYFAIPNEATTAGVSTIVGKEIKIDTTAGATNYKIGYGLDTFYKSIKVSARSQGVTTNQPSLYVECTTYDGDS